MSALTVDNTNMNDNNTNSVGAPVKPSFINYRGDHFDYHGVVEHFINEMDKISIECCCDSSYDKQTYEYEVLAYPNDLKILYSVQIYWEPKRNCHVIEFHRLDGPIFTYRNHIMYVFEALKARGIGPGVSSKAKPMMPTLNEKVDEDDDDFKVDADTIKPILEMVQSNQPNICLTGLTMLLSAVKNSSTQDALKETGAMSVVTHVGVGSSNNFSYIPAVAVEILRLVSAILREGVEVYHEQMMMSSIHLRHGVLQFALQKVVEPTSLEVKRNFVDVLTKLVMIYRQPWHGGEVFKWIKKAMTQLQEEDDVRLQKKIKHLNTLIV